MTPAELEASRIVGHQRTDADPLENAARAELARIYGATVPEFHNVPRRLVHSELCPFEGEPANLHDITAARTRKRSA